MPSEDTVQLKGRKVTLPSGAILKIAPASFVKAHGLFQAVMRQVGASASPSKNGLDSFKKTLSLTLGSEEVYQHVTNCWEKCLYFDGNVDLRISAELFDKNPKAKEDYIAIFLEVEIENVLPFLSGLLSESKDTQALNSKNQKSKSKSKTD
jgi:hypothetical protein